MRIFIILGLALGFCFPMMGSPRAQALFPSAGSSTGPVAPPGLLTLPYGNGLVPGGGTLPQMKSLQPYLTPYQQQLLMHSAAPSPAYGGGDIPQTPSFYNEGPEYNPDPLSP